MNLVINKKMAEVIEQAGTDSLVSRLTAVRERPGNPMGVEIRKFGNATAFSVKNIPGPGFNTVQGLKDEDLPFVDEIVEFYQEKDIPIRFELTPAHVSSKLLSYLHQIGFYQSGFNSTLCMSLPQQPIAMRSSTVSIRKFKRDEFDVFADLYVKGYELPESIKEGTRLNNEILGEHEDWSYYLASIENEPAGIGVAFMKNGIVTIAAAATLPRFRNKGVQTALIKERLNQAQLKHCTLAVGQARFGSISQNNMERVGMRIAYTKAFWTK